MAGALHAAVILVDPSFDLSRTHEAVRSDREDSVLRAPAPSSLPSVLPHVCQSAEAHLYDWTLLDRCIRDNFPPFQGGGSS